MKMSKSRICKAFNNARVILLALFVVLLFSSCSPETILLCRVGISTEDSSRSISATITDPIQSYTKYYRTIYKGSGNSAGEGSGVAMSCGVGCRRGSDPVLLWLWRRPVATALKTPSLGASICRGSGPRNSNNNNNNNNKKW